MRGPFLFAYWTTSAPVRGCRLRLKLEKVLMGWLATLCLLGLNFLPSTNPSSPPSSARMHKNCPSMHDHVCPPPVFLHDTITGPLIIIIWFLSQCPMKSLNSSMGDFYLVLNFLFMDFCTNFAIQKIHHNACFDYEARFWARMIPENCHWVSDSRGDQSTDQCADQWFGRPPR